MRNLERAGIPRSAAMKMVGHKTESIYRRYAIVDEGMLREAAEKLSRFHAGQAGRLPPKIQRASGDHQGPDVAEDVFTQTVTEP